MKAIYFDMDGTIADLYNFKDWLPMLLDGDTTPYEKCKPMVNPRIFRAIVEELQSAGIKIGIISWGAKGGSSEYTRRVKAAKLAWIEETYGIKVDEFHVVKYGTPKHKVRKEENSLLVDDNEEVRKAWHGSTIDASDTVGMVSALVSIACTVAGMC